MRTMIKALVGSIISGLVVYIVTKDFINVLVTSIVVLIMLYLYEIYHENKEIKYQQEKLNQEKVIDNLTIELESKNKLLKYRGEIDVGLIHFDKTGRVIYANEYFYKNIYNIKITHYSEITVKELYTVIREVFLGKKYIDNLHINNMCYAIKYKKIEEETSDINILMQFYDITKEESLDKLHQNFLVDTSHELNNPLSSIIMASEILARENSSEFIDIIVKESYRMKEVIASIIEHSKLQGKVKFKMQKINLSELLTSLETLYIKNDIVFFIEKNIYCEGNYDLLNRMFRNLIENALKYGEGKKVKIYLNNVDDKICFKVVDQGIGIKNENIDLIFNRFYREDHSRSRETGGAGIGLSIVKEIAKVHDVEIKVISELNSGSCFELYFNQIKY